MTVVTPEAGLHDRAEGCPKHMIYGPCGGVRPDGGCEVDGSGRCSFVDRPLVEWQGASRDRGVRADSPDGVGNGPVLVVTDLHVRPRDLESLRQVADRLAGSCTWVLAGDHGGVRNDFPPAFVATKLLERGIQPLVTLSCRDRNRVALRAEVAALAQLGVAGVHCVTGDWQGLAGPGEETRVFDLDCLRLVELVRDHGLVASVAVTPAAPPAHLRPARLAQKVAAGAQVCFVNHCGGPAPVGRFVSASRDIGIDIPIIACVAVTTDPIALAALAALPGTQVDTEPIAPGEPHRRGDSVAAAVSTVSRMLEVPGVDGVNLSGSASSISEDESARIMAAVGRALGTEGTTGESRGHRR